MNSIYNRISDNLYYYSDIFLDYLLYYKITIEESSIIKNITQYMYPTDIKILKVKLCTISTNYEFKDITKKFIKLYEENRLTWQNLCCDNDPDDFNNFDYYDSYLDISYQFRCNNYRAIYHFNDKQEITFPPYKEDELEEHNNIYINKPIFAELHYEEGIKTDITELIKEYSGPLENFYGDKCIITHGIKAKYIKDRDGNLILGENDYLKITDSFANDRIFQYHDILIL